MSKKFRKKSYSYISQEVIVIAKVRNISTFFYFEREKFRQRNFAIFILCWTKKVVAEVFRKRRDIEQNSEISCNTLRNFEISQQKFAPGWGVHSDNEYS